MGTAGDAVGRGVGETLGYGWCRKEKLGKRREGREERRRRRRWRRRRRTAAARR
jgi:hypothetical protein